MKRPNLFPRFKSEYMQKIYVFNIYTITIFTTIFFSMSKDFTNQITTNKTKCIYWIIKPNISKRFCLNKILFIFYAHRKKTFGFGSTEIFYSS